MTKLLPWSISLKGSKIDLDTWIAKQCFSFVRPRNGFRMCFRSRFESSKNTILKCTMELTYLDGRRAFKRERLLANFKSRYAHLGLDVVEQVT